jgi:hypothetical protein
MTRVEWHGDEWMRDVLVPAVNAGLDQASIVLQTQMMRGMGSEGGGVLRKAGKKRQADGSFKRTGKVVGTVGGRQVRSRKTGELRTVGGKQLIQGRGRNIYYSAPPGAYPGVRTGTLRRSMSYGRSWDSATPGLMYMRVGTNVFYGRLLEKGTGEMRPRPWANKSVALAGDAMMRGFTRETTRRITANARARLSA